MLDVADQPKYDVVNQVRAANLATLQQLGLQRSPTAPAAADAVNARQFHCGRPGAGRDRYAVRLTTHFRRSRPCRCQVTF